MQLRRHDPQSLGISAQVQIVAVLRCARSMSSSNEAQGTIGSPSDEKATLCSLLRGNRYTPLYDAEIRQREQPDTKLKRQRPKSPSPPCGSQPDTKPKHFLRKWFQDGVDAAIKMAAGRAEEVLRGSALEELKRRRTSLPSESPPRRGVGHFRSQSSGGPDYRKL